MGRSLPARILGALLACVVLPDVLAAQQAAPPWTAADVGAPAVHGSLSSQGDAVTISGGGYGFSDGRDQFTFAYQLIAGDCAIVARLDALAGATGQAEAGLMIRESLLPDSKHAFVRFSGGDTLAFHQRELTGAAPTLTPAQGATAHVWLKLERHGSVLHAFRSSDGVTWSSIGTNVITMPSAAYVGLAVASHASDALTTAMFSSVTVLPSSVSTARLPMGWRSTDVGNPELPGGAFFVAQRFAVSGGGTDIRGVADQFHYVYREMIGDVEITARVAALERVNVATKAGVMLRDTLSSSSTHASLLVNAAQGIVFERRRVAGGPSLHSIVGTGRTPEWIRLRREGGIVTAYQSADGRTWVKNGTAIVVSPTIYVGLAVTSHDTAAKATALFDYVVTRRPNEPPSVLLTSPADHAAFVAPATVPIAAVSDDPDGSVARVDFFADTSWVGSSSAPPYGTTWTGVAEGRYALRALARDNEGAGAISTSRSILVIREGSSYALFVPSTNHESAVADYVLDIFAAGDDPATDPAVATISLGKPTIVDGECAVDVTTVVDGLPSGTFIATVTAVGPLGSARSHPSPPFAR